ncbi:hypothetical protein J14TS2_36970 [Bacillus sp. J14TS2]|uniref:hypothetical protein n=1 Tax=Bacillus sp. J14TS2 TaxID=2807188 RepID=UPI001B0413B7|nr:hypothetical protein [Bacillus sp. J14TS2]GIN73222.1 hypothetical protein J14TS2_36970 [Bacillus sp. J14TS2]
MESLSSQQFKQLLKEIYQAGEECETIKLEDIIKLIQLKWLLITVKEKGELGVETK